MIPLTATTILATVGATDTIFSMAERMLGDRNRWPEIWDASKPFVTANHPSQIKAGDKLRHYGVIAPVVEQRRSAMQNRFKKVRGFWNGYRGKPPVTTQPFPLP